MQRLNIDDLRATALPPQLPVATEMGVWKRSTGYEVIIPYRRGWTYWTQLLLGLVVAVMAVLFIVDAYPGTALAERAILYVGLSLPILAYLTFLLVRLLEARSTRIRIDLSPLNITITRLRPHRAPWVLRKIPMALVEQVHIRERRGIRLHGASKDLPNGLWIARGLKADDLYYLSLLIGQVTGMPVPKIYTQG